MIEQVIEVLQGDPEIEVELLHLWIRFCYANRNNPFVLPHAPLLSVFNCHPERRAKDLIPSV